MNLKLLHGRMSYMEHIKEIFREIQRNKIESIDISFCKVGNPANKQADRKQGVRDDGEQFRV